MQCSSYRPVPRPLCDRRHDWNDLRRRDAVYDPHQGDRHGELKTPGARTAWVEIQNTLARLKPRLVGVTAYDYVESAGRWIDIEVMDGVDEIEPDAVQLYGLCGWKKSAVALCVDVAPYRRYWSDLP